MEERKTQIESLLGEQAELSLSPQDELTALVKSEHLLEVANRLKNDPELAFSQLIDLCGVDYLDYGKSDWNTDEATRTGFSRGKQENIESDEVPLPNGRFAVVSHLLSVKHNIRIRIKVFSDDGEMPMIPSLTTVWPVANWFEREAFDLFGIIFEGHEDLRRILTDYGFIGHPFRKDFPLIGHVESRYDPDQKRVIYEPVSITPRVNTPRIIRNDNRYTTSETEEKNV